MAVAYADAKGLPYETKTKQQIIELGGVTNELVLPDSFSIDFEDFKGRSVGTWSDDTQHTLAMMQMLTQHRAFDAVMLVEKLRDEYQKSSAGWGGATKFAMDSLPENPDLDYLRRSALESTGCGPLMRLAPLAIFQAMKCESDSVIVDISDATTMTHNSNAAIAAALTVAHFMRENAKGMMSTVLDSSADLASDYESMLYVEPRLTRALKRAQGHNDIAKAVYEDENPFSIWCVAAVAIESFSRERDDFFALIDNVISEGGDTDSTAAVAAGLFMAANPDFRLDDDIVQQLDRSDELLAAGKAFAELVSR